MNEIKNRSIFGYPSIILDIIRLGAALTVFLTHAIGMWNLNLIHNPNFGGDYAHGAVVVFFVLSGYVISYTTIKSNIDLMKYIKSRLSRLHSVLLPGLIITALTHLILFFFYNDFLKEYDRGYNLFRYILTSSFLNEIWFLSSAPPINRPLWSLGFEFWYYIIFGLWFYKSETNTGKLLLLLAFVVAGPKILSMFPIWILGVLAYKIESPIKNRLLSWFLFGLSLFIAFICLKFNPPFPSLIGNPPLFFAGQFITDYILGLFIALAMWVMPDGSQYDVTNKPITIFRKIADLTFPIYVLHNPLLILFKAIIGFKPNNNWQLGLALFTVLTICSIIGYYLNENRKLWSKCIGKLLDYFVSKYNSTKIRV